MIEIDLSSFLRAFGIWVLARLNCACLQSLLKLSASFFQVPSVHQRNGDFKLARLLNFNKISINVLSFGTSINILPALPQNVLMCALLSLVSDFRRKEKAEPSPPSLPCEGVRGGKGSCDDCQSKNTAKSAGALLGRLSWCCIGYANRSRICCRNGSP